MLSICVSVMFSQQPCTLGLLWPGRAVVNVLFCADGNGKIIIKRNENYAVAAATTRTTPQVNKKLAHFTNGTKTERVWVSGMESATEMGQQKRDRGTCERRSATKRTLEKPRLHQHALWFYFYRVNLMNEKENENQKEQAEREAKQKNAATTLRTMKQTRLLHTTYSIAHLLNSWLPFFLSFRFVSCSSTYFNCNLQIFNDISQTICRCTICVCITLTIRNGEQKIRQNDKDIDKRK